MAQPLLYDPTGAPIPPSEPPAPKLEVTAAPEGGSFSYRDRDRFYPSKDLSPSKIESILLAADAGDPFEWVQLCEEMIEKWPKLFSLLHIRSSRLLGTNRTIVPAEVEEPGTLETDVALRASQFCKVWLGRTNFDQLIGDLQQSVAMPLAVDWTTWGENAAGKIIPARFDRIPTSHLRWATYKDEIKVYDPYSWDGGFDPGTPLHPDCTVRALNEDRKDHPTRAGLLRTLVWYYGFFQMVIKDLVAYVDRYGMPLRIIKLDPNEFKDPVIYAQAQAALFHIGHMGSALLTKASEYEVIVNPAGKGSGAELYQLAADIFEKAATEVILGHTLAANSAQGAGQLGITMASDTVQVFLESDCTYISSVIRRDILIPLTVWNEGFEYAHLAPYLQFDFEPSKDLIAAASMLSILTRTFPKLKFSEQQIRTQFGVDEPLGLEDELETAGAGSPVLRDPTSMPSSGPKDNAPMPDSDDGAPKETPPPAATQLRLPHQAWMGKKGRKW